MTTRTAQLLRMEKSDMTLPTLIDLFLTTKQVEGRSKKTVDWYRANLTCFADFLANEDEPVLLKEISLQQARAFVAHLQARNTRYDNHEMRPVKKGGLSPHTIHAYVRSLKAFGSWLFEEGYVTYHPFQRLKPPKLPETMIQTLTDEEIGQIFRAINPAGFLGSRLQAMILLLLDTGIRASELCTLTLANAYLKDGYVKVTGKGNKERMVPIGGSTQKALVRYVHTFRPEPEREEIDELFLSVYGTPLAYQGFRQIIKRLGKTAEVPRLHAHLFRHTFAVRYLMNGGDVMTLRLILGHTTLEVTQMYIHLAESQIQVQHSRFSPVDRLDFIPSQQRRRRKA